MRPTSSLPIIVPRSTRNSLALNLLLQKHPSNYSCSLNTNYAVNVSARKNSCFLSPYNFVIAVTEVSHDRKLFPEYVLGLHSSKKLLIEQLSSSHHLLADAVINLTLARWEKRREERGRGKEWKRREGRKERERGGPV